MLRRQKIRKAVGAKTAPRHDVWHLRSLGSNHETAASCQRLVAGTRKERLSFCPRRYSASTQEEEAFKDASDFEFRIYFFSTAQVPAQRAVATLSTARKCQEFIYFLLVLRHINGDLSTPTYVKSAITRLILISTSESGSCTTLRCTARAPQGHVLAQGPPSSR